MKIKELKDKKIEELSKLLSEKKEAVRVSRFGASGSKEKNVRAVRNEKKTIARILTLINSKKEVKK